MARPRALRNDLIDPTIAVHYRRVVKRTGDGALVELRSVVRGRALRDRGEAVDYYARPGAMTTAGQHVAMLETLLEEIDALVRIVQGVTLHEYVASDQYGFQIPDSRKARVTFVPQKNFSVGSRA